MMPFIGEVMSLVRAKVHGTDRTDRTNEIMQRSSVPSVACVALVSLSAATELHVLPLYFSKCRFAIVIPESIEPMMPKKP